MTVDAESRTLVATGTAFTDSFGPYEAHVYVLETGGTGGTGGTDGGDNRGPAPRPGAPSVTFANPSAGASVSGTTTVTVAGSGGSGSGYTYRLDVGGATVYTGSNGTFSWNTANVANGTQTLTATVTDSAGGSGTATRQVTVTNASTPTPSPAGGLTLFLTQPRGAVTLTGTNWAVLWLQGAAAGPTSTRSASGARPWGP